MIIISVGQPVCLIGIMNHSDQTGFDCHTFGVRTVVDFYSASA